MPKTQNREPTEEEIAELRAFRNASAHLFAAAYVLKPYDPGRSQAIKMEHEVVDKQADEISTRLFG